MTTSPARARTVGRGGLQSLRLTLTESCNLACPYCYQRERIPRTMSRGTLAAVLALVQEVGDDGMWIVLSGGEPLLAPHLVEAVLAAAAAWPGRPRRHIRLDTNGTLLLESPLLSQIVAAGIDLQISCDGAGVAQDLRAPGSWTVAERLFAAVRERHPGFWRRRVTIAMTVTPRNVGHLGDSVAWLLARDVHRIAVSLVCRDGGDWGEAACQVLAAQMQRVYADSRDHRRRTGALPVSYLRPQPQRRTDSRDVCEAADVALLSIGADGTVHGCGVLADAARWRPEPALRHAADALQLGRVTEPDFLPRWRQAVARGATSVFPTVRRTAIPGACRDCEQVDVCLVCPLAGRDPDRVPDAHCLFERTAARQRRELASWSPVATVLARTGADPALVATLTRLVEDAL